MVVCWWKRISYYSLIQTSLIPRPSLPCNNFMCDRKSYGAISAGKKGGLGNKANPHTLGRDESVLIAGVVMCIH